MGSVTSLKEQIVREVERLPESELRFVADYLVLLKFQAHRKRSPSLRSDAGSLAVLYAEFADEDQALAEHGMEDYFQRLASEDAQ